MRLQAISDTHGKHTKMNIDESVDVLIHAGDSTNYLDFVKNQIEFEDFIEWFSSLHVPNKILIAGNHDTWATKKYNIERVKSLGIIYLEDSGVWINGVYFYGSPWTPTFNNWNFMKSRQKLGSYWDMSLSEEIDVLVTHGPPRGILDCTYKADHRYDLCGCKGLKRAIEKYNIKHTIFGHIHDVKDIENHGHLERNNRHYYNVSAVEDGKFQYPPKYPNGIIIEL